MMSENIRGPKRVSEIKQPTRLDAGHSTSLLSSGKCLHVHSLVFMRQADQQSITAVLHAASTCISGSYEFALILLFTKRYLIGLIPRPKCAYLLWISLIAE